MDVKTFNELFDGLVNEHKREVNNVIHYRYLNKPVVVATVDVPRDERIPSYKIVDFLKYFFRVGYFLNLFDHFVNVDFVG